MFIDKEILGKNYHFDSSKDQMLKRGLIDIYELSDEKDEWVVLEEYIFWSARIQSEIIIPRWMRTDLASVPKGMRWLISVNERHRIPALVHDFGYAISRQTNLDRKTWDKLLKDFCKVYNVPEWKTQSIYRAVRIGGESAYKDHSEMFIPLQHREWYKKEFSNSLNLRLNEGRYNVV